MRDRFVSIERDALLLAPVASLSFIEFFDVPKKQSAERTVEPAALSTVNCRFRVSRS